MTVIDAPTYVSTSGPAKRAGRGTPADGRELGFTVVELLVVIGILAVLMSILVLGIRQASDSFALRRAGSIALSEVRRAQTQALAEREDFTVEFVTTPGVVLRVQIYRGTTPKPVRTVQAPEEWPLSVELAGDGGSPPPPGWLPNCTSLGSPGNKCVTFKFMGAPDAGGAVLLRSNWSSNSLWLTISTGTGKVSVQ